MSEAKKRKEREAQVAEVTMRFLDRAELRAVLVAAPVKTEDEMDHASRAIEAIEGDDEFSPPRQATEEAVTKWHKQFSERCLKDLDDTALLTVENAQTIRQALLKLAETGKLSGGGAYEIRHVVRRIRALAEGRESDGVVVIESSGNGTASSTVPSE